MKVLSQRAHAMLDYLVVAVLALGPLALGLDGVAATLSYALAIAVLALSLVTRSSLGVARIVPFRVHGWIELAAGLFAIAAPFLLGLDAAARNYFLVVGGLVVALFALTDHHGAEALLPPRPRERDRTPAERPHVAQREMM